ncbi:alpha-glucan family phosphorylase [Guyparkeria halophila]|uniref:Alpha-glucan family phosphorylase n=1 Tax=Guyparkeria halophila TaxID=47960 RepID=A0ABZ0YZI0_9GAMM|nr:alpha-glucan family phosphorylase [Guyparkeria halophila]WQH17133.1 alpha-glucan family phosphorylase [Guyparkeria halophila]
MPTIHHLEVRPSLPPTLANLSELAGNLHYSRSRAVRDLFDAIDADTWAQVEGNPIRFLQLVPQARLDEAAGDSAFLAELAAAWRDFEVHCADDRADAIGPAFDSQETVAYFCAEFGFHESLPIYSGGLGILAGDHCKAASDLGVPLVGVGLLYRQGYFQQCIDAQGRQHPRFEDLDFSHLPIRLAMREGAPTQVKVEYPGRVVTAQVWEARIGRVRVYLLDTDVTDNAAADREITRRLYGGDRRRRLEQEMLLGLGGVRALRTLGITPSAWHINEGHAAFSILERVRELTADGLPFEPALNAVAASTLFTTHTPVPAGHDTFAPSLVEAHFESQLEALGIEAPELLALGADPAHDGKHFNMTALALRGSRQHNGVSRVHGEVAAQMSQAFWPEVPTEENPLSHVTNGVHVETFLNRDLTRLFDATRRDWRDHLHEAAIGEMAGKIEAGRLWSMHLSAKTHLVSDLKARLQRQSERFGEGHVRLKQRCRVLDKPVDEFLMVGFARRFATYKRATLLFRDRERLARLIETSPRPVVFVFAGKAHPADEPGQALLQTIHELSLEQRFAGHVLLIEGYDMGLARRLVAGSDVWLNTPEFPMEASGTSGQKAGINGVLNLSVADGWWAEGHDHQQGVANGWSIAPTPEATDRDDREANDLLTLLETEVIPLFDRREAAGGSDTKGLPSDWIAWQRHAIATILPRFNASRMVRDYAEHHYRRAIDAHRLLAQDDYRAARERADFERDLVTHWGGVGVKVLRTPESIMDQGESLSIEIETTSPGLPPHSLRCEAVLSEGGSRRVVVGELVESLDGQAWGRHRIALPADLAGEVDYRLRVVPTHETLLHPYELGRMLWL